MRINSLFIALCLFLVNSGLIRGQSCLDYLNDAEDKYRNYKYLAIPDILEDCLQSLSDNDKHLANFLYINSLLHNNHGLDSLKKTIGLRDGMEAADFLESRLLFLVDSIPQQLPQSNGLQPHPEYTTLLQRAEWNKVKNACRPFLVKADSLWSHHLDIKRRKNRDRDTLSLQKIDTLLYQLGSECNKFLELDTVSKIRYQQLRAEQNLINNNRIGATAYINEINELKYSDLLYGYTFKTSKKYDRLYAKLVGFVYNPLATYIGFRGSNISWSSLRIGRPIENYGFRIGVRNILSLRKDWDDLPLYFGLEYSHYKHKYRIERQFVGTYADYQEDIPFHSLGANVSLAFDRESLDEDNVFLHLAFAVNYVPESANGVLRTITGANASTDPLRPGSISLQSLLTDLALTKKRFFHQFVLGFEGKVSLISARINLGFTSSNFRKRDTQGESEQIIEGVFGPLLQNMRLRTLEIVLSANLN